MSTGSDPCRPNPCQSNGLCMASGATLVCTCLTGFSGQRCEIRMYSNKIRKHVFLCFCLHLYTILLLILGDPCAQNPCLNAGQCHPNGMGGFTCACIQPFQGQRCEDRKFVHSFGFCHTILRRSWSLCQSTVSKWRYLSTTKRQLLSMYLSTWLLGLRLFYT
jgi:hypothetical protein